MENKYKVLFFLVLGILIGLLISGSTYLIIRNNQKYEEPTVDTTINTSNQEEIITSNEILDDREEIKSNSDNSTTESNTTIKKETSTKVTSNKATSPTSNKQVTTSDSNTITSQDRVVISYLEDKSNEISSKISDGTYKEKAKAIFIEVVDFLFYNGQIKGHTFNSLTGRAKLEVIKIALKIENKIEEKWPGLLDELVSKYTNVKTKIVDLYTTKTNEYCASHSDVFYEVRQYYEKMKSSFKYSFNLIKEKASDIYINKIKG